MGGERILIVSHLVIDRVVTGEATILRLGGPPCYAGLTSKLLGADVQLVTRFGFDFPDEYLVWLSRNQLQIGPGARSTTRRTTRFRIVQQGDARDLFLEERCEDIGMDQISPFEADGIIVSPVVGEVSLDLLRDVRKRCSHLYLDPQGFLRGFDGEGRCTLRPQQLEALKYAEIVKVDEEEGFACTQMVEPARMLRVLWKRGPRIVLGTRGGKPLLMMVDGRLYRIPVPHATKNADTTGVGDIFAGSFMTELIRQADPVWAACFAAATASSSLARSGLDKIPRRDQAVHLAERCYGRAKVVD